MLKVKYKYSPKSNHKTVEIAYKELKSSAFAVWIRLHLCSDKELARGMSKLAEDLGYTYRGLYDVLKELKRKGYIDIEFEKPYQPSIVKLQYRCLLSGFNRFINL